MSCERVHRRRRPAVGCAGPRSVSDAGVPGNAVAFVRQQLRGGGYATSRPDVFWCPCHEGHAPALRVTRSTARLDDGLALLVCSAGCPPADILRALDLRVMRSHDPDVRHLYLVLPLAVDATA